MVEVEEIRARIDKNKAELNQLSQDLLELHAEDFRAKFKMDIDRLREVIKQDETLLKGLQDG